MKEQFVAKRIVNIGLIFLVAIGFSVIAGRMSGMYLDQLLGIGALTVLFMVLFAFLLIYERNRKRISHNRETDYGKILRDFADCNSYSDLSFPAGVYKSGHDPANLNVGGRNV